MSGVTGAKTDAHLDPAGGHLARPAVGRLEGSRPKQAEGLSSKTWRFPLEKRHFRQTYAALKLPFSLFLALRYLKPKRTFISVITLVSVLGVTLGVTVLILVISVMTGFDRELRQKVIDFDAHILVTTEGVMTDW